ncbi:MAG: Acyl-CoA dehydrogenase domain-containing protein [Candidatus Magnetoglobus multicellularis str. Araruama]|uniref:Acyl-CoA dehydrogenase domain-containing protein n=1 Tax=Candidatus Magnetoglobus multicellularis str. Araruama TaxID=890399 RepID=A0A1V1PE22_9BACT|nr:MAG: Acyl-CoA dehydrogenase domain-containing protein [Candidatus Magnetoglobus multicellularis str. Araruama]
MPIKGGLMYDFLITPEERELKKEVREFVREEISGEFLRRMDKDDITYPKEFVEKLAKRGLRGIRFPKKYGGRGMTWVADVTATEEIGCLGMALGCAFVMPSIVGEAINMFGTEDQKQKYLKPYIEGKLIAAEALTEPRGGSDFFGAMTRAELKGDHFVLNGMKRFVVGAEGADFFLVYCKTNDDPDAHKYNRLSLLIVDKGPGVQSEYMYGLMGCRGGGTGRLVFRDVKVPKENLLGELHGGALCFHQMMIPERLTSAAGCLGVWGSLDLAVRYSSRRRTFGKEIRKWQAVNFKVADSITQLDAARAICYMAARAIDENYPNVRRIVSEAKRFATEAAWDVVNNAMQIMGGIGYTDVYPIERSLRDTRLGMIWTGTTEIMNMMIQHEYYNEVLSENYNRRKMEDDAMNPDDSERCLNDDDMDRVFGGGLSLYTDQKNEHLKCA